MTIALLTPTRDQQICEAYLRGESSGSIARRFGVSRQGVLYVLRRDGVAVRPAGYPKGPRQTPHRRVPASGAVYEQQLAALREEQERCLQRVREINREIPLLKQLVELTAPTAPLPSQEEQTNG